MALNQFPRRAFSGAATLQTFTGNGSTTTFTLSQEQFQNESFVFVDDVAQVPGVDFGINGTSLTFTSAPANNAEIIVRGFGVPAPLNTVSDGAITTNKIAESAITHSKLHTTAISDKLGYTPVSPSQLTTEINNLIAAAPGALNTLDELAAALGDDANFATTVTNALALKANSSSLATIATTGSASDLSTGSLPIERIADASVTAAKLVSGSAISNIGYTPFNKAGDTSTGRIRINGSGFLNSTGLVLNNNGFERVAPEMYSLPIGTEYVASINGYRNRMARIGQFANNGSTSVIHARLVRHGDMNYSNQFLIFDFYAQNWSNQAGNFNFAGREMTGSGHGHGFATDSSRNLYYWDNMQWEQQTYLYIYDMYNFTFSPADFTYNSGLPWRSCSNTGLTEYEVSWGG